MDPVRLVSQDNLLSPTPCCRCSRCDERWDRIAAKVYCPNCQEAVVLGETAPLIERTEKRSCAVCDRSGTVCFRTFPLQSPTPLDIDLCPEHLRALLARRLGPRSFHQLRRQLARLGFTATEIFLLHDAFYDEQGRALQPAFERE
jgi:hypothetical protein